MTKVQRKLWIGLFIMALLTPLGIILPAQFNSGTAWGEWGIAKLEQLLGYAPQGLKRLSDIWKAPIPNYNLGGSDASVTVQLLSYLASGILGILAVGLVVFVITRLIVKNDK
jgi:cobalt/nickel transport protein